RSVTWTDLDAGTGDWQQLFDWTLAPPAFRDNLNFDEQQHARRMLTSRMEALAETVFSGGRRDLESLKIAHASFDRTRIAGADPVLVEAADSAIRLLGKRRRIDTHRTTQPTPNLPKYVRDYLACVAQGAGRAQAVFDNDVLNVLTASRVYNQ